MRIWWVKVLFLVLFVAGCSGGAPTPTGPDLPGGEITPTPTQVLPPQPTAEEAAPTPTRPAAQPTEEETAVPFTLTSPVFAPGEPIPRRYSCAGEDVSPPLEWTEPPPSTQSFVLIMDDPDAPGGTWDHWLLFDLPVSLRGLPEGVPPDAELSGGGRHGQNSWQRLGYGGPCPPSGTHRYFFRLYALDTTLGLSSGVTKGDLLTAMEDHILAQAELMGTYTH